MAFQDFLLRVELRSDRELRLQLLDSPVGQWFGTQTGQDLAEIRRLAGEYADNCLNQTAVERLGSLMYRQIIPEPLERYLKSSIEAAAGGLRMQLYLTQPELAKLPWELMRDENGLGFLALDPHTPLIRYWSERQSLSPGPVSGPLRGVVACASPSDLPRLDVEKEQRMIQEALKELVAAGKVEIDTVRPVGQVNLLTHLSREASFLHFIGHGWNSKEKEEGGLVLEDEGGLADLLSAQDLSYLLQGLPLQLVILGACHSQHTAAATQAVLKASGAAVLAYQTPVEDASAICFSAVLYQALAAGTPLEAAVTTARKAVKLSERIPGAWASPVLSMGYHSGDFPLVKTDQPAVSTLRRVRFSLPPEPYYPIKRRESQLGQVFSALAHGRSSQVSGGGGMGKTALAVEAARRCLSQTRQWERFVWASAKQEVLIDDELHPLQDAVLTYEALLDAIGEQLGYPEVIHSTTEKKEEIVHQALAPGRCLVIVDNLESFKNADELVRKLATLSGESQALLTTRHQTSGNLATFDLCGLEAVDSLYFIRRVAAERGIDDILTADDPALLAIHEAAGGNPLVMKLIVCQTRTEGLNRALKQLEMSDREIYDFICYQSYMLLTDDAKKILRYIAQSQAPVSWEELEMAAEITLDGQEKAAPAIRQLVRLSLVTPEGGHTKRYGVHPLTRSFVMNRLPGIKK